VIDQKAVEKLSAFERVESEDSQAKGIGEQTLDTQVVKLKDLTLGRLKLDEIIAGAMDLSHIAATYEDLGLEVFDMILGGDLLLQCKAIINYEKGWIKLHRP